MSRHTRETHPAVKYVTALLSIRQRAVCSGADRAGPFAAVFSRKAAATLSEPYPGRTGSAVERILEIEGVEEIRFSNNCKSVELLFIRK